MSMAQSKEGLWRANASPRAVCSDQELEFGTQFELSIRNQTPSDGHIVNEYYGLVCGAIWAQGQQACPQQLSDTEPSSLYLLFGTGNTRENFAPLSKLQA